MAPFGSGPALMGTVDFHNLLAFLASSQRIYCPVSASSRRSATEIRPSHDQPRRYASSLC